MAQAPVRSFALRFIAGDHTGGEFPLRPNREILIGRGSEFDMVLDEDMVSRRHAKIVTYHGQIVLQDLKSTNGTFVNGERITVRRLELGDKVLIGNSIMEVIGADRGFTTIPPVSTRGAEADSVRETQHALPPMPSEAAPPTVDRQAVVRGRIPDDDLTVADLLRHVVEQAATGELALGEAGGDRARILLRDGQIYHAEMSSVRGSTDPVGPEKVVFRVLGWARCAYRMDASAAPPPVPDEVTRPTTELLTACEEQREQLQPYVEHLPERSVSLTLAVPLEPPLSALSAEALDTLQLILNHGTVGAALDRSPATDMETWFDLLYLIQNAYVRPA